MELERAESLESVGPPEPEEWPRGHLLHGDGAGLGGCGTESRLGPEWQRGPLGWHEVEGLTTGPDEE